jgi:hypothetical protein
MGPAVLLFWNILRTGSDSSFLSSSELESSVSFSLFQVSSEGRVFFPAWEKKESKILD